MPPELVERADIIFTDSPAQAASYPDHHIWSTNRMLDLADLVANGASARTSVTQITVFSSVGLAGTEVAVAAALYRKLAEGPDSQPVP